jgi:NAD(P)H-dependent flavin oxidoreductase YrpB (nitropropane dioxygenase family)
MSFLPKIIQGGMGVYISNPHLARCCSMHPGILGTVSGIAAEKILTRILQSGDPGEDFQRALAHFPFPKVAQRIIKKYFVPGGIPLGQKFKTISAFNLKPPKDLIETMVAASFALIWLAKENNDGRISVNYLEKIQIPHIYYITGAMLAGVDFITMGAGITLQIPGVIDAIASGGTPSYRVQVENSKDGFAMTSFNANEFFGEKLPEIKRPGFLPIVSTDVLASLMVKRLPPQSIQGFVVELPTAGGHNAPPRGKSVFDEKGQPVYGQRDEVAFDKVRDLGIPFWIGGSFASPEGLVKAQQLGAVGIQVGSIFALSEDSGMLPSFRKEARRLGYRGELVIRTDPTASPTGFPFKVIQLPGTQSDPEVFNARKRICDVCALRVLYEANGKIGYRCSSEPIEDYLHKGGKLEDAVHARCLCNGLLSAAGFGDSDELPIFTLGDDVSFLRHLMKHEDDSYRASDAIAYLLGPPS